MNRSADAPAATAADDSLEDAARHVADGNTVDWDALNGRVRTDEARERLACLQVVAAIAGVHGGAHTVTWVPDDRASTRDRVSAIAGDDQPGGDAWGRYRLLEEVGAGSFGSVYRAWDPELERIIAIKILYADVADEVVKKRVLDEGRALAKVRDANVVTVYGLESHGDRVGLCMDFVQGETLEDVLLTRGALNAREATLVVQDVCRALAAVHEAGFVHRDVKARNVMRERAGRILLMDFGAGREMAELEGGRGLAGTPLYMSPEVLAGAPASRCSDVYSVGVLLYHLVTGKYPVEGRTLSEIRAAHIIGKRASIGDVRSSLPASFIRVVDRALAADPAMRWQSAGALLGALVDADIDAVRDRASLVRRLWRGTAALTAVLGGIIGCGLLSNMAFNHWLGRADFANEGVADWLRWGLKATLAPAVLLMFTMVALSLLLVVRQLLLNTSEKARRVERRAAAAIERWRLEQLENLSSLALLTSVGALVFASWQFLPLLRVLTTFYPDITAAPDAQLALLSPAFESLHLSYRATFIGVTIVNVVVWYPAFRLAARRRERLNRALLAGGVLVTLLTVAMLDFPYRVLSRNDLFEVARWQGERCYTLGERGADVLLFCPRLTPRSRVVSGAASQIERLGVLESPFTLFQPREVQHGL